MLQHGHAERGQIAAICRGDQALAVQARCRLAKRFRHVAAQLDPPGSCWPDQNTPVFSAHSQNRQKPGDPTMDALLTLKMYAT